MALTRDEVKAGLARLAQGFMVPCVWQADVWEVSADHGSTYYVDANVAGVGKDGASPDNLQDYVEGTLDIDDDGRPIATLHRGVWMAQLSAPGYLDQTEPSMFSTRVEAEAYLVEMYDDGDVSDDGE